MTYTIVNNTGKNIWFKGYQISSPGPGSMQPGWLAPGSYKVYATSETQLNAEFIIVDERRAVVMMQQTNGVPQIECLTNIGDCSPRGVWANDTTATFTL